MVNLFWTELQIAQMCAALHHFICALKRKNCPFISLLTAQNSSVSTRWHNNFRYLRNPQFTTEHKVTSGSPLQPELLSFTHNYPAVTKKTWCNPCTLQPARQQHLTSAWPKSATTSGSGICHTSSHLSRSISLKKEREMSGGLDNLTKTLVLIDSSEREFTHSLGIKSEGITGNTESGTRWGA